jgi:hypothetical protein
LKKWKGNNTKEITVDFVCSYDGFRCLISWSEYLVAQVAGGKLPVDVFTPNQHYLQHLTTMIRHLGPPFAYGARCLERTIGGYKRVLKSTKDTGVEVTNVLVEKAAMNHIAINRTDTTDDNFSTSSLFKSIGKIDTGTASDMVMRTPGLTSETLDLLGAGMNTIITTSTKLESKSDTYTSASHKTNSKRKRHSMIFRVMADR